MATTIEIIPAKTPIYWSQLKQELHLQKDKHAFESYFCHKIACYQSPEYKKLDESTPLKIDGSYCFEHPHGLGRFTPGLWLSGNKDIMTEFEVIHFAVNQFGRSVIESVAGKWKEIGYSFRVDCISGREYLGFKTGLLIAKAISKLTAGWVLFDDFDLFDCGTGLIPPERFKTANLRPAYL